MSLGQSQKEMEKAAAVAATLTIIADELLMLDQEIGYDHESEKIRSVLARLMTNLTLRAGDMEEASKPQVEGAVKIVQRDKG